MAFRSVGIPNSGEEIRLALAFLPGASCCRDVLRLKLGEVLWGRNYGKTALPRPIANPNFEKVAS